MPSIVQINVSAVQAPTPPTLQATGAIVSQGATNLASGTTSLLTQASSLTPLLIAPLALTSLVWSGGTVLATAAAPFAGSPPSSTVFSVTISGATPAAYNGTYVATVTGASTFTYSLATNPGSATAPGSYTTLGQQGLINKVNSFFAQGSAQAVYVLELGAGNQTTGPTALQTWITANSTSPQEFYSYLVPGQWDGSSTFLSLLANFENLNSKTYFFITTTTSTYTAYSATQKCLFAMVQSPTAPVTEDSIAAVYQHSLAYAPSSTNRMTPFAFAYLFGVTPYPTVGNGALLATLKAANINYVGTGAEGGISNTILLWGTTLDGNDFTYWYSVDWIQVFSDEAISNAVINGSNNSLSPLYYNQTGINFLQDVVVQTVQNAITFGLANGSVARATLDPVTFTQNYNNDDYADQDVVNAVPFITYTTENPGDYKIGRYAGLSVIYIPQNGFKQIIFNVLVSSFISTT